jgi:Asp-tRNA(Asn)/Glu-tRNA(Gln) amidotransferase A subunit family amidase
MDSPLFATIGELRDGLRRKEFSSVELTRLALHRLESLGRPLNAFATILHARALREARAADKLLARGRGTALTGIPYGAKDLLAARGGPTTYGAPPWARQVLPFDGAVIERLNAAGAVLAAKLAMIELAGGGGYRRAGASLQGPARNPWNPQHWSGGSSSGTGVAVAAGLVPYGIGSETSGSILSPSSNCGVTGLRPTYGLVSRFGAMALAWTMDKLGPMCRTAEDCGIVLETMAGPDPRDPGSAGRRFRMARERRPLRTLRVGYAIEDFETADPTIRATLRQALDTLKSLGVRMSRTVLPALPIDSVARTVIRVEGSAAFEDLVRSGRDALLADQRQAIGLRAGMQISAVDYIKAMRLRRLLQDEFAKLFRRVDVIVAPARPRPAHRIDEPIDAEWRPVGRKRRGPGGITVVAGNAALTPAGNLAGLPGLGVPCGFSTKGLPIAIQLVGRPFEESTLIALGRAYQDVTDWHRRIPPGCA